MWVQWTHLMGNLATARGLLVTVLGASFSVISIQAQASAEWHRAGNAVTDQGLAGLASGRVSRVWYGSGGAILYARTGSGRTFETTDFENWKPSTAVAPAAATERARSLASNQGRVYLFRDSVYRSD